MNARQEATFNMFRDVELTGTNNQTFVNTIPVLKTDFLTLKANNNNISGLASLQAQVISGITVDKKILKNHMAELCYNYSGAGRAWASSNNDTTTYNALNIVISKIKQTPDDLAGPVCQNVYNILFANAAALVPFGLIAAMLGELLAAINDYVASVPLPDNAVNSRQTYTTNLDTAFTANSKFLETQLDNLVRVQTSVNHDFVTTYFNSRNIIDPPTHPTTFKIHAQDEAGNPLLHIKAEVVGTAKFNFTDAAGDTEVKGFRKGIYSILLSDPRFQPSQQDNIAMGLGETKSFTFTLHPIP